MFYHVFLGISRVQWIDLPFRERQHLLSSSECLGDGRDVVVGECQCGFSNMETQKKRKQAQGGTWKLIWCFFCWVRIITSTFCCFEGWISSGSNDGSMWKFRRCTSISPGKHHPKTQGVLSLPVFVGISRGRPVGLRILPPTGKVVASPWLTTLHFLTVTHGEGSLPKDRKKKVFQAKNLRCYVHFGETSTLINLYT